MENGKPNGEQRLSVNIGDLVFFRECRRSLIPGKNGVYKFKKGHTFGIALGHAPFGAGDPPPVFLLIQMGTIGFAAFDDVIEFFGREKGLEFIEHFKQKYHPSPIEVEKHDDDPKVFPPSGLDDGGDSIKPI